MKHHNDKQRDKWRFYHLGGSILKEVDSIKYLGILISHILKRSDHIGNILTSRTSNPLFPGMELS